MSKSCLYATWEQVLLSWTPVVFVCPLHPFSFGNCPSSSRVFQVQLSVPRASWCPQEPLVAGMDGTPLGSGQSPCVQADWLCRAIQSFPGTCYTDPRRKQYFLLEIICHKDIDLGLSGQPPCLMENACLQKKVSQLLQEKQERAEPSFRVREKEQISWLFEMSWRKPSDLARTEDRATLGLLNKFPFVLTSCVAGAFTWASL